MTAPALPQTAPLTTPNKAHPGRRRARTSLLGVGVALTGLLGSVTAGVVTAPAAHASTMTVQVINTGGEGISSRYAPQLAARMAAMRAAGRLPGRFGFLPPSGCPDLAASPSSRPNGAVARRRR